MNTIPIFDCLTHPTLNGDWILPNYPQKSRIEILINEMKVNNIKWAFAVGMEGIGSYNEKDFSLMIKKSNTNLLPIAYFPKSVMTGKNKLANWISNIKKSGYSGVKIHPRFLNININNPHLIELVKRCNSKNLVVLLCTYFYSNQKYSYLNNIDSLAKFLYQIGENKIILLHSGSVRLLETIEIARIFKNVLLDLSFTLNQYEGSSLDLDLSYAFNKFDRRICIGSDFPNFSLFSLRNRFEIFTGNLDKEKKENIAYKNLFNFLELKK
jgi:predicted TIM-barrel fold metal-dependent hydrolase